MQNFGHYLTYPEKALHMNEPSHWLNLLLVELQLYSNYCLCARFNFLFNIYVNEFEKMHENMQILHFFRRFFFPFAIVAKICFNYNFSNLNEKFDRDAMPAVSKLCAQERFYLPFCNIVYAWPLSSSSNADTSTKLSETDNTNAEWDGV